MIPFGDKTITLYNKYAGKDEHNRTVITWYRHVINACFWHEKAGTVTVGETELQTHEIVCQIPQSVDYLPYDEWAAANDRADHFTLSPDDMIALGNVPYVIGAANYSANDVLELCKRTGIMVVTTASDNTGRPLPHYSAKGV